jgi:hypothetical protein
MPMRSIFAVVHALLVILSLCLAAPVVAGDRGDYEKARKIDTIEAYQALMRNNRKLGVKYLTAAYLRIDELQFGRALSVDTLDAWNAYLKNRQSFAPDAAWFDRSRRAQDAMERLVLEQVRAAQQVALAAPSWDGLKAFWDRYPRNMTGRIGAELPELRYELADAVGTWGAFRLYEKDYPDTELTSRLKHSVTYRYFEKEPALYAALNYLRAYPDGEQSAGVRRWIEADQSAARAGDLRVQWVGGQTLDIMNVPTGEAVFVGGSLRPAYTKTRPKQGTFLVARFTVYNLGGPRRLEPSQFWIGDGRTRKYVASELVEDTGGGLVVVSNRPGIDLSGIGITVRALFDLPRSGYGGLRLFVDGTPTLLVAEMPLK